MFTVNLIRNCFLSLTGANVAVKLRLFPRSINGLQITSTGIEGIKIDAKALKIETEAVREGASYRVTVTYQGGLEKGNYTGKVILSTSDTEEPSVEVPLYIVVA